MTFPERLSLQDGNGGWMNIEVARPVDGEWLTVIGASGGGTYEPPPFTPDTGPLRNIATNAGVLQDAWKPGATGAATATRHMLHANADSIKLGYFARPNPGLGAVASTPLRAWVRHQCGTWTPATFSGQAEVTLTVTATTQATLLPEHAQNVYTDPIPGVWRNGDVIEVLTWGQASSGTLGVQGALDGAYDLGVVAGPPSTVSTAAASSFIAGGKGPRPSAIIAPSPQKSSWALIGDSNSVNPDRSYMAQAFRSRNLPHILNGKHGLGTYHLITGWWDFQLGEQVAYCDSVFSALGSNDGHNYAIEVRQQMVDAWLKAKGEGVVRWVQATIPPRSLTEGSTAVQNPWLRDGAPIIDTAAAPAGTADPAAIRATVIDVDGTIHPGDPNHPLGLGWVTDTAAVMETTPGSGAYRQDLTPAIHDPGDLTHYPQAGHDLQAAVLKRDLALMGF